MKTIGLVGGVASGKSLVAKMLVELGAGLLDADRTGHAVLDEDDEVRETLAQRWGDAVLSPQGRAIIARIIFADTAVGAAERKFLEELLHPRIRNRLNELRNRFAAEGKSAVVLDAPLLLEAGWKPLCDLVIFVDTPYDIRLKRAQSRGWSDAHFTAREASQWPVNKKRQAADIVLSNAGTESDLRTAVDTLWRKTIAKPTDPT